MLGLACDKSWRIGDKRAHTIIDEKNNGWIVNSGLPKTASLEEHMQQLLQRLEPYKDRIKLLSSDDNIEFSCVIYATTMPALNFDNGIVEQLNQFGASLDIDLYVGE